ncbi:PREDICTED: GDSL esterase/lipase At1g71250-like [Nelumbo nucifera]|uniref:GDSL esterase/lipase At1g71250-like n=2 Tax=Nelumbo nucifera TaxID=4432 RepID=A0A1U8B925_NELNU|nr:PREDICTED: GDSL esterase/lipase At1g71250-like [Nelumbo nucifera]DAD24414.1 TPA_asm: hypothetical protein HUJ06_025878 [Nelumbo nucifera]
MAVEKAVPVLFFFFSLSLLPTQLLCGCREGFEEGQAKINGLFVFGSSLVDNGNNNHINSTAKADYLPYGVDFPLGPSGRFTNGKNVIDLIGELLQLPSLIPPFADPMTTGDKIVHGVNFASGGSGILDDTGSISGQVINLNQQIKNFEEVTLPQLGDQLGRKTTETSISDYLFVVGTGGNDYLLNYFLPNRPIKLSLGAFTSDLIAQLSQQLEKLYSLGGRKFILMSIYPIGCIPVVKKNLNIQHGCVEALNQAAHLFNTQLKSLVDDIKPKMPGSNVIFVDSYQIISDIINDPTSTGFNDTSNACCEVLSIPEGGNGISCKRNGRTCGDRKSYVFFDGLHPSESVNTLIAKKAFASNLTSEVYPINVQQLAKL